MPRKGRSNEEFIHAPGASGSEKASRGEVSLVRLYVLRATYLLIGVGEGTQILPSLIHHDPAARGVIASLLGAMCLLDLLGVRYPLQMLPLLLFELTWKAIWLFTFGLPQRFGGHMPPTFAEDFPAIAFGVILMPFVIPWGFVYRRYIRQRAERWR
jgi:hypothetical protein